jgi:hypothetical protein
MIQSFPGKLAFDDLAFDNFPIMSQLSPAALGAQRASLSVRSKRSASFPGASQNRLKIDDSPVWVMNLDRTDLIG